MISKLFASTDCIEAVKLAEGFRARWYKCPAGKDTIGYGHVRLKGDTYSEVTKAEAEAILIGDLTKFARQLWPLLKWEPAQYQFDAILSMAYNTGVGIHDGKKGDLADSDLLLLYNSGHFGMAADEFLKWTYYTNPETGRKEQLNGLIKRRSVERAIFLGRGYDG